MTNPMQVKVPVILDKPRTLYFNAYSLYWLSERYENPNEPFEVLSKMASKDGNIVMTKDIQKKFFDIMVAGLIHEDENLNAKTLMSGMPMNGLGSCLNSLAEAIKLQFAKSEKPEGEPTGE